jgi:ABC-type transport system involved in cytochrome bd biosynthesis fused ATPase/permease subunit
MKIFFNAKSAAIIMLGLLLIAMADVSLSFFLAYAIKVSIGTESFLTDISQGYLDNNLTGALLFLAVALTLLLARLWAMNRLAKLTYESVYGIYIRISASLLSNYLVDFNSALKASTPGLITKKLNNDANHIVGGLIIPICNLLVEILVFAAIFLYSVHEIGAATTFGVTLPLLAVVAVVAFIFKNQTLKLGKLRNEDEERKSAILVNFEKSSIDIVVYEAKQFAQHIFNSVNERLASTACKQNINFLLSRVSFESIFSVGILAIITMPFIVGNGSGDAGLNQESIIALVSVVSIRLLPGLSRVIQLTQTIAYVLPTAKLWLGHSSIHSESALRVNCASQNSATTASNLIHWADYTVQRDQQMLLRGREFYIDQGEFVSIFGKTGSGKTSLLTAIFLTLERNQLIDKKVAWVRQNPGNISQDPVENLILAPRAQLKLEKLNTSLTMAGFDQHFINQFSRINTRSDQFSGGQVQRLNLARAFYHDTNVLLLDEFTSALDTETESQIYTTLARLKQMGLSAIFVSHRESIKQHSDRMYFIENGEVTEVKSELPNVG